MGFIDMSDLTTEIITDKKIEDRLKKFEKKMLEAVSKEKEHTSDPITKGDLKNLKSEMLMWMIGILIGFCTLIFWVIGNNYNALSQRIGDTNQRIDDTNQRIDETNRRIVMVETSLNKRIDSLEEDIKENNSLIQKIQEDIKENNSLIQKILDNQIAKN